MFICDKCKREFSNKGGFVKHNEKCPLSEEVRILNSLGMLELVPIMVFQKML
jgi:hypothetical protein